MLHLCHCYNNGFVKKTKSSLHELQFWVWVEQWNCKDCNGPPTPAPDYINHSPRSLHKHRNSLITHSYDAHCSISKQMNAFVKKLYLSKRLILIPCQFLLYQKCNFTKTIRTHISGNISPLSPHWWAEKELSSDREQTPFAAPKTFEWAKQSDAHYTVAAIVPFLLSPSSLYSCVFGQLLVCETDHYFMYLTSVGHCVHYTTCPIHCILCKYSPTNDQLTNNISQMSKPWVD